jgi:hypothetical protein
MKVNIVIDKNSMIGSDDTGNPLRPRSDNAGRPSSMALPGPTRWQLLLPVPTNTDASTSMNTKGVILKWEVV